MGLTAGATIWLVHMGCAAVFLAMAVLVIARRPRALIHRTCGIVIADFALWSGCLAVSHLPHVSRATAARFYDIGAVAWAPFASLALLFLTSLSRPARLRSRWFVVALIVPAAFTLAAQWSGHLAADYVQRPWGWAYVWADSGATTFFHLYYSSYVLFGVTGLLLQAWQGLSPVRRRQAQIIGWSALPPLVLGSLTDVVLPRAGVHSIPNMGPDFALIWVVGLVYALVRYRVLELRPVVAAERVMQMMSDALLLVDADEPSFGTTPPPRRCLGKPREACARPRSRSWWGGPPSPDVARPSSVATTARRSISSTPRRRSAAISASGSAGPTCWPT